MRHLGSRFVMVHALVRHILIGESYGYPVTVPDEGRQV